MEHIVPDIDPICFEFVFHTPFFRKDVTREIQRIPFLHIMNVLMFHQHIATVIVERVVTQDEDELDQEIGA